MHDAHQSFSERKSRVIETNEAFEASQLNTVHLCSWRTISTYCKSRPHISSHVHNDRLCPQNSNWVKDEICLVRSVSRGLDRAPSEQHQHHWHDDNFIMDCGHCGSAPAVQGKLQFHTDLWRISFLYVPNDHFTSNVILMQFFNDNDSTFLPFEGMWS